MLIDRNQIRPHPTFKASHPIHNVHRIWILLAVTLTVLGAIWYGVESLRAQRWLGGSSLPGFTLGCVAFGIILFEMLIAGRKTFRIVRWFGRVKYWMAGHVWLGLACLPLAIMHCGVWTWGGQLTIAIMILLFIVILSGVYGLYLQNIIPKKMLKEVEAETIYSQIDRMSGLNLEEAERVVLTTCGPPENPADLKKDFEKVSMQTAAFMTFSQMKSLGNTKGKVLETRAPSAAVVDSEALRVVFLQVVKPYLIDGYKSGSPLLDRLRAEAIFHDLKLKLPPEAFDAADRIKMLCDLRRQYDRQIVLHRRLHRWLWVHLPCSWLLLILMFAHIYYALRYW